MNARKINFPNRSGQQLVARLEEPEQGQTIAWALFAHCFTCTKNLTAIRVLTQALTRYGIGVFSFDFTGLGESEGDFADTAFSTNVTDIADAARWMQDELQAPGILIGHSLGGTAVLKAAGELSSVQAVATIGAPADAEHVARLFRNELPEIEAEGEALVHIQGRPFRIKKQFVDDLRSTSLEESIGHMRKALLVLHSPVDNVVGIENATRVFLAARHPKSFIGLDGADHLLSRKTDADFAGEVIGAWARRYVQPVETEAAPARKFTSPHQVAVRTGKVPYTTDVRAGRHRLIGDEPLELGGQDHGPNPYDFLLTALGCCTSMTIKMYADRRKWPVDEIQVHLDHEKIHATDCADCETREGKIDRIERQIKLYGDLSAEQRTKLMEIADKCPVHRTLHSEIKIETRLLES